MSMVTLGSTGICVNKNGFGALPVYPYNEFKHKIYSNTCHYAIISYYYFSFIQKKNEAKIKILRY